MPTETDRASRTSRRRPTTAPASMLRVEYEDRSFDIDLSEVSFADVRDVRLASGLSFAEMAQASAMLAPEFLAGLVWLYARKTDPQVTYADVIGRMRLDTEWEVVTPQDPPA